MVDYIKQTYEYVDGYIDLEQSVSDVIKDLLDIQDTVPEEFRDGLKMSVDYGESFFEVRFYYMRDKTEAERAADAAAQERYKECRRKQYEEMKKEFEGG